MLKRLIGLFIIILLFVVLGSAQSQQSTQNSKKSTPKIEGRTTNSNPSHTGQNYKKASEHKQESQLSKTVVTNNNLTSGYSTAQKSYNYQDANLKVQRQLAEATKTIADFTIYLVLATVVLGLIAIWQGIIAKKTADAAKINAEVAISSQRAFISIKNISAIKLIDPIYNIKVVAWRFITNIENSGNTAAINVMAQVSRKISDSPPLFTEYIEGISQGNWGAHQITAIGPLDIPVDDLGPVYDREKHLYIFGKISYYDNIPDTPIHIERFCQEVILLSGPFDPAPGTNVAFITHPTDKQY